MRRAAAWAMVGAAHHAHLHLPPIGSGAGLGAAALVALVALFLGGKTGEASAKRKGKWGNWG